MRQLTFISPGKLEWQDVPEPALQGPGEAIVAPVAVATCDLDPAFVRGLVPVEGPFAFGHECVARVVQTSDDVTSVRPGDLVAVPFQITCGECAPCRRGDTAACDGVEPRMAMYGMAPLARREWGGALSDRVRVPYANAMLAPLPSGIDPTAVASISDNLPDAWRTVGPQLDRFPDASVLVVAGGAPSIGLYSVAIARALGAAVTYVDSNVDRLSLAASLGADVVDEAYPRRQGRHLITVDASASPDGLACAIRSTAGGGVCTSVGIYYGDVPLPLLEMYTNTITFVTGRVSARPAMPRILDLVASGSLKPELVTTSVVNWTEAAHALNEPFTKLVMVP